MRSQSSIITVIQKVKRKQFENVLDLKATKFPHRNRHILWVAALFFGVLFGLNISSYSQTLAILDPVKNSQSVELTEKLSELLSEKTLVLDASLVNVVFQSKKFANPFNLSIDESKNMGASIGCSFFVVVKTDTQRRSSFERNEYYESHLAMYLVSSRTGKLVSWKFTKFEEDTPDLSKKRLFES